MDFCWVLRYKIRITTIVMSCRNLLALEAKNCLARDLNKVLITDEFAKYI